MVHPERLVSTDRFLPAVEYLRGRCDHHVEKAHNGAGGKCRLHQAALSTPEFAITRDQALTNEEAEATIPVAFDIVG